MPLAGDQRNIGRPISLGLAEESLADLIRHSGRVVRLPDIEKAVCEVFGLEPASLQSDVKGKRVSHPRMLAMWLARKHTRAALSEIGHYFGRRSHSTVISAQTRVEGWMSWPPLGPGRASLRGRRRYPSSRTPFGGRLTLFGPWRTKLEDKRSRLRPAG